jgi:hypothetical protein
VRPVNSTEILRKVRSAEGRALATKALRKQIEPPTFSLALVKSAHAAAGKFLNNETVSDDEARALDAVIKTMQPKRQRDDVEFALFAQYRDGSPAERELVKNVLREMASLSDVETGHAPAPLFKSAPAPRKTGKLVGKFFR